MDIESIMKQDKGYLKIIEDLVKEAKSDIIVFEKSVSRKIVERIRDVGITLIMNVEMEELKKLAHIIQADILQSIELIEEPFERGTCKEFIVQDQMETKT